MTNFFPHDQTLVLKGFRNQATQLDIQNLGKRITPYLINVKLQKDKYPYDPNFGLMAYFNYRSPEQATQAKLALSNEIRLLNMIGDNVDISRVVVVERTDLTAQVHKPSFTLWVGNIHDATEDDIRRAFGRFGEFVPAASGLKQVAMGTSGEKRYAFVNFARFESVDAALRSCDNDEIAFDPAGSDPVVARPRGSVLLVQQLLLALENTPSNQLRFSDAEAVVRETERSSRSSLDGWLDLLRRLPRHFVVDAARTIRAARGPSPPPTGPAASQPGLIQPEQGQGGGPAATGLSPLPSTATLPSLTAAASAAGDITATAAADPPPRPPPATDAGPLCVVCQDAPVGAALQPCFHAAYCMQCAGDVLARALPCPVCRAAVEGVQRIFLP
jgi:RNA recognition motif-containing protein